LKADEVIRDFLVRPGTASNTATMKYLNQKKVPQIFVTSGAAKFSDPKHFPMDPWDGFPHYRSEGGDLRKAYHLAEIRTRRLQFFIRMTIFGRDYLAGLKEGLGRTSSGDAHRSSVL